MAVAIASPTARSESGTPARICLGPGAPDGMAQWLQSAGLDVLPYQQKHLAPLYVDFIGARPPGVEVVSIDLGRRGTRSNAEIAVDNWQTAACLVVSRALRLKHVLLTADLGMLATIKSAIAVAASPVNVVISGEIGTAKYSLARLIHAACRHRGALLTVNCVSFEDFDVNAFLASLPDPSPAAAAAGAHAAPETVLYLDEIGELEAGAQVKLLHLMQTSERSSVAGAEFARPALRFIAATNRPLAAMVDRGEFRRELYWRLNVFGLAVAPLRERPGDITLLARYFLRRANPKRVFAPTALKALAGYAFPGNSLELESLVTRLAITPLEAGTGIIDFPDVRRHLMAAPQGGDAKISGWKTSREQARRDMILRTIAAAGGSRAEAARRLGITLRALQYHITKAGLSRRRGHGRDGVATASSPDRSAPRPELGL